MRFSPPLTFARFIRRYKRFLTDVIITGDEITTVHCPNSGSMKTCMGDGWKAAISTSNNPKRKYPHTLEMTHNGKTWIGVNTILANHIVLEAIEKGLVTELKGYEQIRKEVPYGKNSRIDLLLENNSQKCFVEIKNVTLVDDEGYNSFPDARTERGLKHLTELIEMVKQGNRAVMFYLIQRSDGKGFRPAREIDPDYAKMLREAHQKGVEVLAYMAAVSPDEIVIQKQITDILL